MAVGSVIEPCAQCVEALAAMMPNLVGAAASVGIERGLTTGEAIQQYAAVVHQREGHS